MYEQGSVPTPLTCKEDFRDAIRGVVGRYSDDVAGMALSIPGTIEPASGHVFQGGTLTYHNGVDIVPWYEEEFGIPIAVENDARCAALAECGRGALQGIQTGVVLTFGTGVGCAIVIGGQIHRGAHLFSGEVSASILGDVAREGMDAVMGNKLGIGHFCERVCRRRGVDAADGRTVFGWIGEGDAEACVEFERYCADAAVALFNLQLTLDPERVAIGGGVSANPLFLGGITAALDAFYERLPVRVPRLDVTRCAFCNDANLMGAFENLMCRYPALRA